MNKETLPFAHDMPTIDQILWTLSEREEKVLRWRFGIGIARRLPARAKALRYTNSPYVEHAFAIYSRVNLGKNAHTIHEIALHLSRSNERVRQIESKALRKLRRAPRLDALLALFENGMHSTEISNLAFLVLGSTRFAALTAWDPQSGPMPDNLEKGQRTRVDSNPVRPSSAPSPQNLLKRSFRR